MMSTSESGKKEETTFKLEEWQNSELSRKQPRPRINLKRNKVNNNDTTKNIKKGKIIPDNQKSSIKTIGDLKNKKKDEAFHFDEVKIKTEKDAFETDPESPHVIKTEKEIEENSKRVSAANKNLKGLLNELFTEKETTKTSENDKNCIQNKNTVMTVNIDEDDNEKEMPKIKKEVTSTITNDKKKSSCSSTRDQRKKSEEKKVLKILLCLDPDCQKEFEHPSQLNKHVLSQHPKIVNPIQCPKENCKKVFISKEFLQNHITKVHKKVPQKSIFKCRFCTKVFYSKVNYDAHKKSVHMKDWKTCPVCKKIVKNLDSHIKIVHLKDKNTMEECTLCDKMVKSLNMGSHLKTHSKEPKIVCLKCGKLVLKVNMSSHQLEHVKNKKLKCRSPGCSSTFPNKIELEDHIYKKHKEMLKFKCNKCSYMYLTEDKLRIHKAQNHQVVPTLLLPVPVGPVREKQKAHSPPQLIERNSDERYRKCPFCLNIFEAVWLQKHIKDAHLKPPPAETETVERPKETQIQLPKYTQKPNNVQMPSCTYTLPYTPQDTNSKNISKGPKCRRCKEMFNNFNLLRIHQHQVHLEHREFRLCEICQQLIKNNNYDNHMNNVHGNINQILLGSGRSDEVNIWVGSQQQQQPDWSFQISLQNPWVLPANQAFFPPFGPR